MISHAHFSDSLSLTLTPRFLALSLPIADTLSLFGLSLSVSGLQKITLDVEADATIDTVMAKFEAKAKLRRIPAASHAARASQRLFYGGTQLEQGYALIL